MTPQEVQLRFLPAPKISSLIHASHDSVGLPAWKEASQCSHLSLVFSLKSTGGGGGKKHRVLHVTQENSMLPLVTECLQDPQQYLCPLSGSRVSPQTVPTADPFAVFQKIYYHLTGELYVGLISEAVAEDNCLTDPGSGENPTLEPCSKAAKNGLHIYWDFKSVSCVLFKGQIYSNII